MLRRYWYVPKRPSSEAVKRGRVVVISPHALHGTQAMPGLSPDDDITPWEVYFVGVDEDTMIVGHMPFIGRLAFALCHGRTENWQPMFRNAEVACIEGAAGDWTLAWHLSPDDLKP